MSSLYGKGNAAASGQIQMAANFYGTSNITYLADGTITAGRALDKSSRYYYGRHENTPNNNSNIGSFSLSTNTIGLYRAYQDPINNNILTTGTQLTKFIVTGDTIDIDTVKLGSTTKRRRYGELDFSASGTDTNIRGTFPIMTLNSTYDVEIVKFADDDPFCTMTFTAAHWSNTNGKGETSYYRGYNTSGGNGSNWMHPKGSATSGTTAVRNPENNSSITTVTGVYGENSTAVAVGGGYSGKVFVTINTAGDLRKRIRFAVLSRSTDSNKIVLRRSGIGNSDFEPSGSGVTKLTAGTSTNNHLLFNTANASSSIYSFLNSTSATYTLKIV
jgi:hypothetical protein